MNLIIVESPTKAKTLGRFLGKDYDVCATVGHIKDLPKSKLSVDVEKNFKPDYILVASKEKEINEIEGKAKKAEKILIATDPDREGEAIAQHILEYLSKEGKTKVNKDKITRIVFHEITQSAVERAIQNPRPVNRDLVNAQIGRRVLDRLVGYKLSPLLWKKIRRGLSAGRVQSVTVRLIVEKEDEIKKFKPEEYWEIISTVKSKKGKGAQFDVLLLKIDDKTAEVNNKKQANEIVASLKKASYEVSDVRKKEVVKQSLPPFITLTLTQASARNFGWSAKRTMANAQRLYEKGLITYHRTDSVNIAQTALSSVRDFIKEKYGEKYLPPSARVFKTKAKVAQEAHEAVRPTNVNKTSESIAERKGIKNDHKKLYVLIWSRFVASQMTASVSDQTAIDVVAGKYLLRASGQVLKFDGWRAVYGKKKNSNGEIILPEVEKDEDLNLVKVDASQKFTLAPARFNEASLIKALGKLGIGRPSTYAPIISTIQIRQYVEKKDGRFYPTPVGIAVTKFLSSNFSDIVSYQFTAAMEDDLDHIAHGKVEWRKMMEDFYTPFEKILKKVEKQAKRVKIETEKLGKKCPDCKKARLAGDKSRQGELVIRIGKFGKFVSCSRFPDCKFSDKYEERIGMKCPDCKKGHVIVKKTKKGRQFFGCSKYPECEYASWKNPKIKKE